MNNQHRSKGQFIFATCIEAGLEVTAQLRNSIRRFDDVRPESRHNGMTIEVSVFEEGMLVFEDDQFANIGIEEVCEVSKTTCPALVPEVCSAERVVVTQCSLKDNSTSFYQEHQLFYENPHTGFFSCLLYDQWPLPVLSKVASPIVLLAPKLWLSSQLNTLVCFASTSTSRRVEAEEVPLEISVLSQDGGLVYRQSHEKKRNSTWVFNARQRIGHLFNLGQKPLFFTLAARGGSGSYAITTFIVNEQSGCFALEHSLPPFYYMDGDRARVRREANWILRDKTPWAWGLD